MAEHAVDQRCVGLEGDAMVARLVAVGVVSRGCTGGMRFCWGLVMGLVAGAAVVLGGVGCTPKTTMVGRWREPAASRSGLVSAVVRQVGQNRWRAAVVLEAGESGSSAEGGDEAAARGAVEMVGRGDGRGVVIFEHAPTELGHGQSEWYAHFEDGRLLGYRVSGGGRYTLFDLRRR